jgi:putative CocE/NonD family hydrolase
MDLGPVKNANEKYLKGTIDFWNQMTSHPDYDDFWQSRSTLRHLQNISPAVLTVGGWYDSEDLSGALQTYKTIEENNPGATNMLVMGPWTHGGWSSPEYDNPSLIPFRQDDPYFYQYEIEYKFFNYYLKEEGIMNLPEAWVYETGSDRWRSYETWPPENLLLKQLWLSEEGSLSWTPPDKSGESFDEFISDPDKPVPYTAPFLSARSFYNRQYLAEDQRFASTRPDVLVYKGGALERDMTVAGPVEVELFVTTTGTDADWVVKLIDVFPDTSDQRGLNPRDIYVGGYQMLVRGDIFRGKYRNSFEKPEPFIPGEVTRIHFTLPDLNHTFQAGHQIMLQVQSSWFPLFDRNPQTFTNIYLCGEDAFQPATHRVYHSSQFPTNVKLPVLIRE